MSDEENEHLDRAEQLLTDVPGASVSEEREDAVFDEAWEAASGGEYADKADEPGPDKSDDAEVVRLDEGTSDPTSSEKSDGGARFGGWAVAAVALLSAGLVWWAVPWRTSESNDQTSQGFKSPDRAPEVELIALTARREDGKTEVGSRLASGDAIEPGEHVLFRYRTSRSTHVALFEQTKGGDVRELWRSDGPTAAHETEIQADGRALALDPAKYDGSFTLALVAGQHKKLDQLTDTSELTSASVGHACSNCGIDILKLQPPPKK